MRTRVFIIKFRLQKKGEDTLTETFYFTEENIGHAVLLEKEHGEVETVQESHIVDRDFVYQKLSTIDDQATITVAGNSGEYILSVKL